MQALDLCGDDTILEDLKRLADGDPPAATFAAGLSGETSEPSALVIEDLDGAPAPLLDLPQLSSDRLARSRTLRH